MTTPRRITGGKYRTCDSCDSILYYADLEVHSSSFCPPCETNFVQAYIKGGNLYSFAKLYIKEDDKSCAVGNENIVMPIAAIQFCNFVVGGPVIVTCDNRTFVKYIWPSEDLPLTNVYFCRDVIIDEFKGVERVKVERFQVMPIPAKTVEVCLAGNVPIPDREFSDNLMNRIALKYEGRIIKQSDNLRFHFYARNFIFEIYNIIPYSNNKIVELMNAVSLHNNQFYMVSPSTTWTLKVNILSDDDVQPTKSIGGLTDIYDKVINIILKTKHQSVCGIILYGISGTGKTLLANTIAYSLKRYVVEIKGWEILSNVYGQSETNLRQYFEEAITNSPSVILMDRLETLCKSSDLESRIVNTLQTLFDVLRIRDHKGVAIIGTTSNLSSIDSNLRSPERFDYEIKLPIPNEQQRKDILTIQLSSIDQNITEEEIDIIAHRAQGFVGADLLAVVHHALTEAAVNHENITYKHLCTAITKVKPLAIKEVLVHVPNVKWTDIGGQDDIKLKLKQVFEWPLKHPEAFKRMGITPPRGVLLYGPPGCSKTMLAKAVATESHFNFISVKGPELFNKCVGESELAVHETFIRAKSIAPCVVFFDELDGLAGKRGVGDSGSSGVHSRVLGQLLTELDGVQPLRNVSVLAATNRPDLIDSALLRPGRLDRKIYVPLPDNTTRLEILKLQLSKMPISIDVDINKLVELTEKYSGAEVISICQEASLKAMEEDIEADKVEMRHFEVSLQSSCPQTPLWLLKIYEVFSNPKGTNVYALKAIKNANTILYKSILKVIF